MFTGVGVGVGDVKGTGETQGFCAEGVGVGVGIVPVVVVVTGLMFVTPVTIAQNEYPV